MILSRRGLIIGGASLLAAPAIVKIQNIMPVKALPSQAVIATIHGQGWDKMGTAIYYTIHYNVDGSVTEWEHGRGYFDGINTLTRNPT